MAQIIPDVAEGESLTVTLKGSLDNDINKAVECAHTDINGATTTPTKVVKPVGEWWLYFWLVVETTDENSTVQEAYIGAGGC